MPRLSYYTLLSVICFCSLRSVFCMETISTPILPFADLTQQKNEQDSSFLGFIKKYLTVQNTTVFLAATENALRKTLMTAGSIAGQSLRFVVRHPVISVTATGITVGVACAKSESVRDYAKKITKNIISFAFGRALCNWLGLDEQNQRLQELAVLAGRHMGQIEAVDRRIIEQNPILIGLQADMRQMQADVKQIREGDRQRQDEQRQMWTGLHSGIQAILTILGCQPRKVSARNTVQAPGTLLRGLPVAGRTRLQSVRLQRPAHLQVPSGR